MKISSYALAISMLVPYTIHAQSIEWLKDYGGSDALETSNTIAIDSQGSTYTVGKYYALTDFDPGTGVHELTANNTDAYILKLDANGNFLWVRTMGGDYDDEAFGVAVDEDDNVYFSGDFQGDALQETFKGMLCITHPPAIKCCQLMEPMTVLFKS